MSLPTHDARGHWRGIDERPVTLPGLVGMVVLTLLLAAFLLAR